MTHETSSQFDPEDRDADSREATPGAEQSASGAARSDQAGEAGEGQRDEFADIEDYANGDESAADAHPDAQHTPASEGTPESDADRRANEHLADLKRVQAEYANYRNRTQRETDANRKRTIGEVVRAMLPVLDDLDRAEKHGDLKDGPMSVIATKLRGSIEKLDVTKFGEAGEAFDPQKHEAIAQLPNPNVTEMTVADVVEPGYYSGDQLIRAAKVAVFVPQN